MIDRTDSIVMISDVSVTTESNGLNEIAVDCWWRMSSVTHVSGVSKAIHGGHVGEGTVTFLTIYIYSQDLPTVNN